MTGVELLGGEIRLYQRVVVCLKRCRGKSIETLGLKREGEPCIRCE